MSYNQILTYDQLMEQKARRIAQAELEMDHQPKSVNKTQNVEQAVQQLYNEAFERKAREKQKEALVLSEVKQQANKPKIDIHSQKLLLKKTEKQLQCFIQSVYQENSPGFLNIQGLCQLLINIGLFESQELDENHTSFASQKTYLKKQILQRQVLEEFWKLMTQVQQDQEVVADQLVFNYLIVLLEGQLTVLQSVKLLQDIFKTEKQQSTLNLEVINEDYQDSLSEENVPEQKELQINANNAVHFDFHTFVIQFKQLYEQRREEIEIQLGKRIQSKTAKVSTEQFTFQPNICNKSRQLVNQNNYNDCQSNCYESLFQNARQIEDKKRALKEKNLKEQEDDPECSFHPQVNKRNPYIDDEAQAFNRLYEVASKFQSHKEELRAFYEDQRQNEEMAECTFKPKSFTKVQKEYPQVKGFDAILERQQKARKIKLDKENYFAIKEQKQQKHDTSRVTKPEPFMLRQKSFQEQKKVLVYVDVRVTKGKKIRIALRENDNPLQIAKNFARAHSLNSDMLKTLENMLLNYMQQFSKDDETSEDQSVKV